MDYFELPFIFSAHGFGINTNIIETNVINLAIVITVVISFVGDALKDLLEKRKQTIKDNTSAAENRQKEAENKRIRAQEQLQRAKTRAMEIKQQGSVTAKEEQALCVAQAEEEALRLQQRKDDSIRLQQQKAIQQISKQIIGLSIKDARKKAIDKSKKKSTKKRFHKWVNRARFVHYRTVDKYLQHLV